ncbi:hypothetical protein DN549_35570, partial [Burkholderia multivorans]
VRLLTSQDETLEGSDLDDRVYRPLRADISRLDVIGRSGPSAAKFDPVMIRELARVRGLRHVLHGVDLETTAPGKDAKFDALRDLLDPAIDG